MVLSVTCVDLVLNNDIQNFLRVINIVQQNIVVKVYSRNRVDIQEVISENLP